MSEQRHPAQRSPSRGCSRPARAGAASELTPWRSMQSLPPRPPRYPTGAQPACSMAAKRKPRGGCDASSRTSGARAAEARGATHAAHVESGSTHGVRAAHLKAIQHGAARRLFAAAADMTAVSTLTVQRIRGGENTRHAHCSTMNVSGPGRGDASGSITFHLLALLMLSPCRKRVSAAACASAIIVPPRLRH